MITIGNFIFKFRNIIFPLVFIMLVVGFKPMPESGHAEVWRYAIGTTVALAGQMIRALTIGLAYIIRGGKDRKVYARTLVKDGIFAHCRNPLYLGNILIVIGLGIAAHSVPFYLIGIPLFIFMYMAIIRAEEHFLANTFGEEYVEYSRKVNRLIPDMSGLKKTIGSMQFKWRRLLVKEYGTTYSWIVCMILLIMKNHYLDYGLDARGAVMVSSSVLLILVTVLYAVARFLKKSGRVKAD
jgi:protein-S-isoprenylcysteine O-methyltransferase Ste14